MEYRKISRYIQVALVIFFVLLLICIAIRPTGLIANSGISYYGKYWDTLVPYTLAFLTFSAATWKSATLIKKEKKFDRNIRLTLQVCTILFLGVLLTPHTVFPSEHVFFGTTLFCLQLVLGTMLVFMVKRDVLNTILLAVLYMSGLASLIFLNTSHGWMIQVQVIFQISIWILFIRIMLHLSLQETNLAKQVKVSDKG
ncbi:MAG: hypothetical protein NTV39_01900 [Candidatus Saccharibacteria bacterium]|nr:hypothetical protein [Candidatus Saccharibacteria bacterium]